MEVANAYKDCRQLQLLIQLFNNTFANYIFAIKNANIGVCIVNFSLGIHLFHTAPIASHILLAMGSQLAGDLQVVFQHGFIIPQSMAKLKKTVVGVCNKEWGSARWTLLRRMYYIKAFRSIRNEAVKVGSFHKLERMSTPRSYSFILSNVVRMLIAFR